VDEAAGKVIAHFRHMAAGNCCQASGILAIDDERGFLSMLKVALECQGFIVHTVSSPKEAIKLYEERGREIRLVLLDYLLPEMSGELVFENLQRLNPDVRVVLLTGSERSVADKMFQKGLRGYLKKPFSVQELGQKIRDAIAAPAVPFSASVSDISGKGSRTASVVQKGGGATTGQLTDDTVRNQRRLPDPEKCQPTKVRILDIFFKCLACGRHFVAADTGAGVTIDCPDCNTPTTIPEIATIGKCPRCRQRLKFSPEMKGESVHCPACHEKIRLPGEYYPRTCPKCGAAWDPPLHRCQRCSYRIDNPVVPTLIPD
jgi:CheY-like chemotaxis protein/DNA-directed RNA polymerase subunit RPC12/RpoP